MATSTENATHTPGPWRVSMAHWMRLQISSPDRTIGELSHYVGLGGREVQLNAEQDANGHLIAAAPDLLAACRAAYPLLILAAHAARKVNDFEAGQRHSDAAGLIGAAMQKARGE